MPAFLNPLYRNFRGHWIWLGDPSASNHYTYFRKELIVTDRSPVTLYIAADTRYRLYINGQYVRCGSIQSQPYNTYFDQQDISACLREGRNILAFEVYYGGHIQNSRGGLLFEAESADGRILAVSDGQTKALPVQARTAKTYGVPQINRFAPYQEWLDARLVPEGWNDVGFNDTAWPNACVVGGRNGMNTPPAAGPWTKLSRRPIPDMRLRTEKPVIIQEEECIALHNRFRSDDLSITLSQAGRPLHVASIRHETLSGQETLVLTSAMDDPYGGLYNPALLLDFGHEVTAYMEIEVEGHAGQVVEIGYAERLVDGRFNNAIECPFSERYTLKEGRQVFRAFHWRGYRYVRLLFQHCDESLRLIRADGIVTEYPLDPKGGFTASDRELTSVFDICRNTVNLCCNESIVDTPWREQSQWMGDVAAVTLGALYALHGETALPRKFLTQSAANQLQTGFITNTTNTTADNYQNCMIDYNFWWVIAVWQYYLYTGDEVLIHGLYPTVSRIMQAADVLRDEYGMLNRVPFILFLDWAPNDHRGESTALNAIFYGALDSFLSMARLKKDDYMIRFAEEARALIRKNFSARFFSPERGLFADANVEGVLSPVVSEAGNMLPIYFGLASEEESASAIDRVLIRKDPAIVEACPFLAFYTLRALHAVGRTDLALAMIREKWYGRFVAKGESSTTEEWGMNGSYRNGPFTPFMRTRSHAWSAGPAEFLVKDLNRLELLEPGGRKISVTPFRLPGDYEVRYPTPHGTVTVQETDGHMKVSCDGDAELLIRETEEL